ncbi:MAG TPA: hypothetical protein VHD84_03160 [Candidatus Saccharimonadales bacterium]|nr:hypothetical protein [Candidatus Saccharimonadales bacterium]
MSKRIARLLDEPEHQVAKLIKNLEAKNGYPSHDVRLLAENIQKARTKLTDLGLDADDTTGEELYQALMVKFKNDSRRFDEHFGVHLKGFDEKAAKAAELVTHNVDLPEQWVLKNSAAKALLRQQPPKKVMKQLRYRSIESMLKREDLAEIYLAAGFMESGNWSRAHQKLVSALDTTAFELRKFKVVALSSTKWGPGAADVNVLFSNDLDAIGLAPSNDLKRADLLTMVVMLLDGLKDFADVKVSQVAELSPAVAWWSGMDAVIARLGDEHISFNAKDLAEDYLRGAEYEGRRLNAARRSFWNELYSRYENQLEAEEDALHNFSQPLRQLAGPVNQPAFEYVEDI